MWLPAIGFLVLFAWLLTLHPSTAGRTYAAPMAACIGVSKAQGPNYVAEIGDIELSRDGRILRLLHPEKRSYISSEMPMTEAAIDANGLRHVYVALGEPLADGAWSVRVYYKPFVDWIWIGCILMALGGLLASPPV